MVAYHEKHQVLLPAGDYDMLTRTTRLGIRRRMFEGVRVFDSAGTCRRVLKASRDPERAPWLRYLLNAEIGARLEYGESEAWPLEKLRSLVLNVLRKDPDRLWSAAGTRGQAIRGVTGAKSHRELIEALLDAW